MILVEYSGTMATQKRLVCNNLRRGEFLLLVETTCLRFHVMETLTNHQ